MGGKGVLTGEILQMDGLVPDEAHLELAERQALAIG